ncbi:MAG: GNAT family N-acetyltransferase [Chloroflexota bacterium]|nr:GNAT family N-acetyltransferase [Chloroflexota bacterium]
MKPLIRPFTPDDYPAFAAVASAAYSDTQGQPLIPILEEEIRAEDAERDPTLRFGRWVAEVAGQVVGGVEHNQNAGRYHPHKFLADVFVQPRYQGQGIGTALHQHIMEALRPYDPLSAQGATREDLVLAVAFLERRGWQEALRMWESFLDVTTWDPTPFNGVEEAVRAQDIAIKTLPELADDSGRNHKLYDLVWEIRQDFPSLDAATRESFEEFVVQRLNDKQLIPQAFFVAVCNGEYVGYTSHSSFGDRPDVLRIGQTGVKRAFRRRRIAQALKLRGAAYARAHGFRYLRTVNESRNRGILTISERMGFVKRPAWIEFVKTFREE